MVKLVVGLGNPGKKYSKNRHNIGQRILENYEDLSWKEKFNGVYAKNSERVYLIPTTYMNLSGKSVLAACQFFKINVEDVLLIYDELDLSFGEIKFKKGGGVAGHNGPRSVIESLGSKEFYRMRVGISRPSKGSVSDYVLNDFSKEEEISLRIGLDLYKESLNYFLKNGLSLSAQKYHNKELF